MVFEIKDNHQADPKERVVAYCDTLRKAYRVLNMFILEANPEPKPKLWGDKTTLN